MISLGEDVPALIPIAFSIALFLFVLYHGLTTIGKVDSEVKAIENSIEIASLFSAHGSISKEDFDRICEYLKTKYSKFEIILKNWSCGKITKCKDKILMKYPVVINDKYNILEYLNVTVCGD
jgi:hypothetical protein